jgi:heme-degrading monooxygenase HmoA
MIIRIVRMHFREDAITTFLDVFKENQEAIRTFPGCIKVELLKDRRSNNTYATLSHWSTEEDLEQYRKSRLFEDVWSRVKPLFAARPEAFSLERVSDI